ncbi:DUF2103 domain-containing protein [Desulfitobacterium sp. AusDCA]|uniref:DUF2103 domain-containing protein n=1 Tax=Desulfitobacterium sp. AusDCA TaxID=3240383 RepID=UPI003DA7A4B7
MKYRRNKVKREHGIIHDALTWLEELGQCADVSDIIPGVIEVSRSPEKGIVYKYQTQTGCKLLIKSNGSIQEAFVVTKNPDSVKKWVEHRFPVLVKSEQQHPRRENPNELNVKEKAKKKGTSKKSYQQRSDYYTSWQENDMQSGNLNPSNLGQHLNSNTRQALRALQKDLDPKRRRK